MDVEWVVHRMIGLHLIDEPDLYRSPTVNAQAMAPFSAPVFRSMSFQIMFWGPTHG